MRLLHIINPLGPMHRLTKSHDPITYDLVRRCIGPQGLIICKNLKNEKNQAPPAGQSAQYIY